MKSEFQNILNILNSDVSAPKKKAVVLLSGGLDSYVSMAAALKIMDVKFALTFDYNQRALEDEIEASSLISKKYGVEHRVIKLPFLGEISNSLLNKDGNLQFETLGEDSAKAVWVPNRNGLFLNIAACFCDAYDLNCIIFGANKEEAETFKDNSNEFIKAAGECFKFSAKSKPDVFAPLSGLEKFEIINLALYIGVDLSLLKSCYNSGKGSKSHCGTCESCRRLKAAILKSENKDLIKLFF